MQDAIQTLQKIVSKKLLSPYFSFYIYELKLEEIYNKYKHQVYTLSLHYTQNKEDAEEITQDVFVAVYKSIESFRAESKLSTWIYQITIHKCLDFIKRKRAAKRNIFLLQLFGFSSNIPLYDKINFYHPGIALEDKEALDNIFVAINELPPNQKTVLILSKLEHKSQVEVAEIMNLSIKAVESLYQRAKNNLKIKLNKRKDF